jgi:endonuclease-3
MRYEKEIIKSLKKSYTTDFFSEQHDRDPFKVLVSCLISLRTRDEVTYPAAKRLFRLADTPRKMMRLSLSEIQRAIYPAGFYKTKARRIKDIAGRLYRDHASRVPESVEELLKFKGVGRKTANIVMVFGFNKPAIPVDTHVHKISNRLGWVRTKTPDDTERELTKGLSRKYWLDVNELFVRHGQSICFSVKPWCSRCQISKYCSKAGLKTNR